MKIRSGSIQKLTTELIAFSIGWKRVVACVIVILFMIILPSCSSKRELSSEIKTNVIYASCNFRCVTKKTFLFNSDSTFTFLSESGLAEISSSGKYHQRSDTVFFLSDKTSMEYNLNWINLNGYFILKNKKKFIYEGEVFKLIR